MNTLKLSLIHLDILHKRPDENREALLSLVKQSGGMGARLIVAAETSVSGYYFENRDDIAPFT